MKDIFKLINPERMRNAQSSLIYRWFDEVWNQNRRDSIDELASNNIIAHGLGPEGQTIGTEEFKIFYDDFKGQLKDVHVDVEDVVSQDDMECALCKVTATDIKSDKKVEFSGICMVKIENGKIAEAWNHYDFLKMYQQMGFSLQQKE